MFIFYIYLLMLCSCLQYTVGYCIMKSFRSVETFSDAASIVVCLELSVDDLLMSLLPVIIMQEKFTSLMLVDLSCFIKDVTK